MAAFRGVPAIETGQWDDYERSLVEAVYENDNGWTNWDDVIDWIEEHEDDYDVPPEAVEVMKEDFQNLKELDVDYTSDPGEAYELAHRNRGMQ